MINFDALEIKRVIVHFIAPKADDHEHSIPALEENIIYPDESVQRILFERLNKAQGMLAKSFELEIENYSSDSFFGLCREMKKLTDEQFISRSCDIAQLLATCQKRNSIPGGYLIIIDARNSSFQGVTIAIKAELQEALKYEYDGPRSNMKLLDDIFLSPSQRLYKIGALYERNDSDFTEWPNDKFGAFLYDSQFNPDSKPAEYFYKDFLGLSAEDNPKIQSKRFFAQTENFIKNSLDEPEGKEELLHALKHEFKDLDTEELSPMNFAESYFPEQELIDNYAAEVADSLPENIVKDDSLFRSRLEWKKINFPNKVNLSGPDNTFDYSVKIIKEQDDLDGLHPNDSSYTILKIKGRPYDKNF